MIDVHVQPFGDSAEAESIEAAVFAARTILEDNKTGIQGWDRDVVVGFYQDGELLRQATAREVLEVSS